MELLIILSHTTASIQEDHEPTNEFFGLFYQLQLLFFSVPVLKLKLSMDIFPKDIFPKDIYPDLSWYKKVKIKKSHCNYFEYTDVFCHSKINRYNNSMIWSWKCIQLLYTSLVAQTEGWQSGRMRQSWKLLRGQLLLGFESLSFRILQLITYLKVKQNKGYKYKTTHISFCHYW